MPDTNITVKLKTQGFGEVKTQVSGVNNSFKKFNTDLKRGMEESNSFVGSFGQRVGNVLGVIKSPIALVTVGIVGITKALKASIGAASEFQTEFANVTTLFSASKVQTTAMQKELLKLPPILGSATDLTKGLYQAISAGQKPAEAIKFVAESAKFAKAALVDTRSSVDLLTTVLNAYGLEATQTTRISDILFKTIEQGKTTGIELAGSLGAVIPIAAAAGVSIEEVAAATATLTKGGLSTAEATTALRAVLVTFLSPTKEATETAKRLGVQFDANLLRTKGLAGGIAELQKAFEKDKDAVTELIPNVRALTGVLALAGKQADDFRNILDLVTNSAGATQTAFEKQVGTLSAAFDELKNNFTGLLIEVGQLFLPFVTVVVKGFNLIVTAARLALQATKDLFNHLLGPDPTESSKKILELGTRFLELKDKTHKTVAEEIEFNRVQRELRDLSPTVIAALNKQGDAFKNLGDLAKLSGLDVQIALLQTLKATTQGPILDRSNEEIIKGLNEEVNKLVISLARRGLISPEEARRRLGLPESSDAKLLQSIGKELQKFGKFPVAEGIAKTSEREFSEMFDSFKSNADFITKKSKKTTKDLEVHWGDFTESVTKDRTKNTDDWFAFLDGTLQGSKSTTGKIVPLWGDTGEEIATSALRMRNEYQDFFDKVDTGADESTFNLTRAFGTFSSTTAENIKRVEDTFMSMRKAFEGAFSDALFNVITGRFENLKDVGLRLVDSLAKAFSDLAASAIVNNLSNIIGAVSSGFGLAADFLSSIPAFAKGGFIDKPTVGLLGEAGPEVVIPLNLLKSFLKTATIENSITSNLLSDLTRAFFPTLWEEAFNTLTGFTAAGVATNAATFSEAAIPTSAALNQQIYGPGLTGALVAALVGSLLSSFGGETGARLAGIAAILSGVGATAGAAAFSGASSLTLAKFGPAAPLALFGIEFLKGVTNNFGAGFPQDPQISSLDIIGLQLAELGRQKAIGIEEFFKTSNFRYPLDGGGHDFGPKPFFLAGGAGIIPFQAISDAFNANARNPSQQFPLNDAWVRAWLDSKVNMGSFQFALQSILDFDFLTQTVEDFIRGLTGKLTEGVARVVQVNPATYEPLRTVFKQSGPRGGFIEAAKGFSGVVDRPTMFLAGEAGSEFVNIIPSGVGGGATVQVSAPISITGTFSSELDVEGIARTIALMLEREINQALVRS